MGISLGAKLSKKHMNKRDRKKDELVVRKNHEPKLAQVVTALLSCQAS